MIISASRRTDIPAFYSEWFMNRIRAGYCAVPNPFNRNQISYVSLSPADVDVIVFWTRHARPLMPYLLELDERGYRYYFQYTVMDNPRLLDPKTPALKTSIKTFRELAEQIGPEKVIWRYDPIFLSTITDIASHERSFARIALQLKGATFRSVISIADPYRKTLGRLGDLSGRGVNQTTFDLEGNDRHFQLMQSLASTASDSGMEITSCAEEADLRSCGIQPGKCVDDDYIARTFGVDVESKKDPGQREACGCVVSKDIGMYDTCLFGCVYCYATSSFRRAARNHQNHDPASPSLTGWHDAQPRVEQRARDSKTASPADLQLPLLRLDL